MPWKSNPVMIFYNKDLFKKAGLDPENPPLATYDEFLATSKKIVDSRRRPGRDLRRRRRSEFFQSWFDFYPLYAAETGGKQLVEDGKATFDDAGRARRSRTSGRTMYAEGLRAARRSTTATRSPTARPRWRSSARGRSRSTRTRSNWGVVPVPTSDGMPAEQIHTFSDAKNVGHLLRLQEPGHRLGRAEVRHQQGAGRQAARDDRPDAAAHRPADDATRTTSRRNPEYKQFADQAARTVEVPNVPNSVEIWQTFRDDYSSSVIFGKTDGRRTALTDAAAKVDELAGQS